MNATRFWTGVSLLFGALLVGPVWGDEREPIPCNTVTDISVDSQKNYDRPFLEVTLDARVTAPDGSTRTIPAFWAGGRRWTFRFAADQPGDYAWRLECSDRNNRGLHGVSGTIRVVPYSGDQLLRRHGPITLAADQRHFQHADGTPFFWLADTWWKNLSRRMSWDDFQELAADRKAKGFSAVQIVCGPYPDEEMMETRWENEGGKPYEDRSFTQMNPAYFADADRRIAHLVDAGIVPVIVGGWGRPQGGGRSTLEQVGLEGFQRHWRHLLARYGAYPVIWIVGGEVRDEYGPWSQLARFIKDQDPWHRPLAFHAPGHPRETLKDPAPFDFDMVGIGHQGWETAEQTLRLLKSCREYSPVRPVLCGEACYEGHMQTNFQDVQRHLFWTCLLSGAAGHTYGAAGVWQASIEGDPGITPVYDFTTWREGMNYPGSTQLGIGKKLLEQYAWSQMEPHPEWAPGCFAAGIPGQFRIIYLPRRGIYDWSGPKVVDLEPDRNWHAYYFDPATGRKFDQGILQATASGQDPNAQPLEFSRNVPSPQDWVLILERVD